MLYAASDLKPLSVTTKIVSLQTDNVGHVGQNSRAHVAHVVGSQTDAVDITETGLIPCCYFTVQITDSVLVYIVQKYFFHDLLRGIMLCGQSAFWSFGQ